MANLNKQKVVLFVLNKTSKWVVNQTAVLANSMATILSDHSTLNTFTENLDVNKIVLHFYNK